MASVRRAYTLRTPLNYSWMDVVINPSTSRSQISVKWEITIRTLVTAGFSVLLGFWLATKSFIAHGGFFVDIGFYIGYILFVVLLAEPTSTQQTGYQLLKPMYHFFIDRNQYRKVSTRAVAPIKPVDSLIGIRGITRDNGTDLHNTVMVFNNGDIGEILELSGNASIMLFPEESDAIIRATDIFLKRLNHLNISITFDSVLSVQRVKRHLKSKDELMDNLQINDPGVINSLKYQRYIIKNHVGRRYHAWHQYAIVRAGDRETLMDFNRWIYQCKNRDHRFVRGIYILKPNEVKARLHDLYGDDVSNVDVES